MRMSSGSDRDFTGPDFTGLISPNVALDQERELQFVLRFSSLRSKLAIEQLPSAHIHQQYFAREQISSIVATISERQKISSQSLRELEFTSARTRAVSNGSSTSYFLQAKGPKEKEHGSHVIRPEISTPVTREEYFRFASLASCGEVKKTRSLLSGAIEHHRLGRVLVVGEIDIFHSFGEASKLGPISQRYDFARVDIELPEPKLAKAFRRGEHTFDFLAEGGAIELGCCSKEIRKAFSTRRLASTGIDNRFLQAWRDVQKQLTRRVAA